MMRRVTEQAVTSGLSAVQIAASQKSAPFFARFDAIVRSVSPDGWGPGLDRVDMLLVLDR